MKDRLPVMKQSKPRNLSSKKLLFFLFLFFITLLTILFFQSSLSKITEVTIEGQALVAEEQIRKAAAVVPGDHFFSVSGDRIVNQIKALRMIESVEVNKRFPGRIDILVKEYPKVAYQFGDNGQVEALLSDGSVVPVTMQGAKLDMPILSGWSKDDPLKIELCRAMARLDPSLFADVSEIMPWPSQSFPDRIKMYTRSQFEVVTTIEFLPQKMPNMEGFLASLRENDITSGVLTMLLADSHAPFPANEPAAGSKKTTEAQGKTPASPQGGKEEKIPPKE
ncbi:cell division protein FtsQ/DivIB [Paenibacillus puerhi]|uniref:cell division protein FtsQ/DivIB n=1 Tax=Paenibacillus puerhi TaxID=2692622 RepID=UPI00135691F7|nr:FtsQ-type POTRA domain-containing protein [Paenibacillus puerhi]